MKPFYVLIASFLLSLVVLWLVKKQFDYALAGRIAMAIMLLFTAIGHFIFTEGMVAMIPRFIPMKNVLVLVTGILEILFAFGLLLPKWHYLTGWILICFLVLILPANIKASLHHVNYQTGAFDGPGLSYLWFRVPLQLFFALWVYFAIK